MVVIVIEVVLAVLFLSGLFVCVHFPVWHNAKMACTQHSTEWLKVNDPEKKQLMAWKNYYLDNYHWWTGVPLIFIARKISWIGGTIWRFVFLVTLGAVILACRIMAAWKTWRKKAATAKAKKALRKATEIPPQRRVKRDKKALEPTKENSATVVAKDDKTKTINLAEIHEATAIGCPTCEPKDAELASLVRQRIAQMFEEEEEPSTVSCRVCEPSQESEKLSREKAAAIFAKFPCRTKEEVKIIQAMISSFSDYLSLEEFQAAIEKTRKAIVLVRRALADIARYDEAQELYDLKEIDYYLLCAIHLDYSNFQKHRDEIERKQIPLDVFARMSGGAECLAEFFPGDTELVETFSFELRSTFGVPRQDYMDVVWPPVAEKSEPVDPITAHFKSQLPEVTATSEIPVPSTLETKTEEAVAKVADKENKSGVQALIKQIDRKGEVQTRQKNKQTETEDQMKFLDNIVAVLNLSSRLKGKPKEVQAAHDELVIAAMKKQAADIRTDAQIIDGINLGLRKEFLDEKKRLLPIEQEVSNAYLRHYVGLDKAQKALKDGTMLEIGQTSTTGVSEAITI